jgi:hypothetical protein
MCVLWVHANRDGAATGYQLDPEPDPFATGEAGSGEGEWKPSGPGVDPFELGEPSTGEQGSREQGAGEQSTGEQGTEHQRFQKEFREGLGEPDPFELEPSEGRASEPEASEAEPVQMNLAGEPERIPLPPRRPASRVARAVKGGRRRKGVRYRPPPPPEPVVIPLVTPSTPEAPKASQAGSGPVEPEDVERLERLGLEVDVDGWGDKPVRLVSGRAGGDMDDAFELSFRDAAAVANILHAFPGARITGIIQREETGEGETDSQEVERAKGQ